MRSITIRLFIVIASILIAIILAVQVYWLNKTYNYQNHEFRTAVVKSIRGVYEDLPLLHEPNRKLQTLIEKVNEGTFLFETDSIPPVDSLVYYVHDELENFNVFTGCILAVYDAGLKNYSYSAYLPPAGAHTSERPVWTSPKVSREHTFVLLSFPYRSGYIFSQMRGWILSSVFLLVVLMGFAVSLYYFFKQKFLVEIQKDFINNVTHEFSTPLSVIELSLDGLEKESVRSQPERHSAYVNAIRQQAAYLQKHVASLAGSVRVGTQSGSNLKKVLPNELLKKAVLQLEPMLDKKSGSIEWNLETENRTILADEDNLYLAIFNIINNAIKFADKPAIIITTTLDKKYTITIKDNGVGMKRQELKKIFHKFYRVQNGNLHLTEGLGLGLYISKKIIERHHGKIRVNSIAGIGTEFRIELPLNG